MIPGGSIFFPLVPLRTSELTVLLKLHNLSDDVCIPATQKKRRPTQGEIGMHTTTLHPERVTTSTGEWSPDSTRTCHIHQHHQSHVHNPPRERQGQTSMHGQTPDADLQLPAHVKFPRAITLGTL